MSASKVQELFCEGYDRMASTVSHSSLIVPGVQAASEPQEVVWAVSSLRRFGLTSAETDDALLPGLLVGVVKHAVQVFGEQSRALRWLRTEKPALGGRAPLEEAQTEAGCWRIEEMLIQMEEGMVV